MAAKRQVGLCRGAHAGERFLNMLGNRHQEADVKPGFGILLLALAHFGDDGMFVRRADA